MSKPLDLARWPVGAATLAVNVLGVPARTTSVPRLALDHWIRELSARKPPPIRGSVVIVATRNDTWLQFATYAGCWARKLGYAPILLYSSAEAQKIMFGRNRATRRLRRLLVYGDYLGAFSRCPDAMLFDLDTVGVKPAELGEFSRFAEDYAHTAAAYDLRTEERETGILASRYSRLVERYRTELERTAAKAFRGLSFLRERHNFARVILPSGLVGVSSAYHHAARKLGLTTVCVETYSVQPGLLICNENAPALDIDPRPWLEEIGRDNWARRKQLEMEPFIRYQEAPRPEKPWLRGHLRFQRSSVRARLPAEVEKFLSDRRPLAILAPCGIADSGTLRRQRVFQSQREWIVETCRFFRAHPEYKLIFRAHPVEYAWRSKLSIRTGDIAAEASKGADNILVIPGDARVSTYALMPHAHVGLVWVSNVGVDMVIRGCPVVAAGNPIYSGLGLIDEPHDAESYFSAVVKRLSERSTTNAEQQDLATRFLAVVYRDREFPAFGPDHLGRDIELRDPSGTEDRTRFFKILVGDLPIVSRPTQNRA